MSESTHFYKHKYIYLGKYIFQSLSYKLLFLLIEPFLICMAHKQPKDKPLIHRVLCEFRGKGGERERQGGPKFNFAGDAAEKGN